MPTRKHLMEVALGQKAPEITLKGGQVFNVFTGEFEIADIALAHGRVAAVGSYQGGREIDVQGHYLTPGFIDSHVHIESGLVGPAQFAKMVVPAGTTTVIADPHEIANVAGLKGLEYILRAAEKLPLNIYVMLPSCVPATPLESSGATLTARDLATLINHPRVLGLGEMMNFPGVFGQDEEVWAKIDLANHNHRLLDGHAPGLTGPRLSAYAATGISSDHEALTAPEAKERLKAGMALLIREGSAAKNLLDLLPVVNKYTCQHCLFATDDRHPEDLLNQGHINYLVRLAVEAGLEVPLALKMATLNAARHFRLYDLGALAPGYRADILVFKDLKTWKPHLVFKDGRLVAENGQLTATLPKLDDSALRHSVNLGPLDINKLRLVATSPKARVIGLKPYQLLTDNLELIVPIVNGAFVASAAHDILKLAVFERHRATGRVGLGLVKGFGLKSGAIASTVAHDSHNLVVAGLRDDDIILAAKTVAQMEGGLAVVENGRVLGALPLALGGLMADKDIEEVKTELAALQQMVKNLGLNQGCDPFMTLAFLSLPVIPSLKLTDQGLVDVDKFSLVPVSV